jgi:predicted RNA binding protein YcfA (HicA-like mRNA interferase family)
LSPRIRQLSGNDVVRTLRQFGFSVAATKGSHVKLRRYMPDGSRQTMTIPLHEALATGTAHAIFRQASLYIDEQLLKPHFFTD